MDIIRGQTSNSSGSALSIINEYKPITSQQPKTTAQPKPTPSVQPPHVKTALEKLGDIGQGVLKSAEKVIGDIKVSFSAPKVSPALPESVFKQVPAVNPAKPIQITPDQKKIDLKQIAGGVVNKIANAEQSVFNVKLGTIGKNLSEVGKILSGNTLPGMSEEYDKLDPWSKLNEASKIFGMLPTMQVGAELKGAKDALSAIRGFVAGYGAGSVLKYAAQDPKKRSIGEAIKPSFDNMVFAYFTGSTGLPNPFEALKKTPDISKAEYIKSRDFLKEMGVKEEVFSKPEALKKSYFDLAKKYHPDLPTGNASIFKKINNAYKTVTDTFYDVAKTGDKSPIAGLLEDGEHTPQEVIGKVISNNLEKTTEGKALIKSAVEAQRTGQNITISKTEPQNFTPFKPPVEGGVGGTPPVSPTVKSVSGGEVKEGSTKPQTLSPEAEADRSLLTSDQAKQIESQDTAHTKEVRAQIDKLQEDVTQRRQENEVKKSILDQFNGKQIKAMRTIKNSIAIRTEKGLGTEKVSELKSYQDHIRDVMAAIGTDSESEALRFIQEDLPDAIINANDNATIKQIEVLKTHITPKEVSVPKEQLPVGEGKLKVSKLEARMKGVIGKATQEQIDNLGLSTYQTMNKADQIAKASEYVVNNREKALEVLKGQREAPPGILPESIYVALTELAKGDITLATKLATLQATALGQRIGILSEIDKDNPVRLLNEVYKVREEAVKKKFGGKSLKEVKNKVIKSIKEKVKIPDKYDWNNFINSIDTC